MATQAKDPGTGTTNTAERLVNRDGTFNIKRIGALGPFSDIYHHLVNLSWPRFLVLVFATYTVLNTLFALVYLACGVDQFNGIVQEDLFSDFLNCFFFSAQSLTTVGYGNISPNTHLTQLIASFEALIGVMSFALITGLFYGRFSRPVAKIIYSNEALVAPFNGGKAIMMRLANKRQNVLINVKVSVLYSCMVTRNQNERVRSYFEMPLTIDEIDSMPLSWTLVHPIDEKSPFFNKSFDDLKNEQGEIYVQFRGFDDTFHENVFSRHSYLPNELIDNAVFERAFETKNGITHLDLNKISHYRKVDA